MSLDPQNWEKYPEQSVGAFDINDVLDAVFDALSSATLANGDTPAHPIVNLARFQSGGTDTEAVYGEFTGGTGYAVGLGTPKFLLCGSAAAKTPTMRAPDNWQLQTVYVQTVKNAGAYNAWDDAAPFTTGNFAGIMRSASSAMAGALTVRVYVGIEGIIVEFARSINTQILKTGALWDAETTFANSPLCVESDGRLYGTVTSGSGSLSIDINYVNAGDSRWLGESGGNGGTHCGSYTPGGSGWNEMELDSGCSNHSSAHRKNRNGGVVGHAIHHRLNSGNTYVGRLRECFWGPDERSGYIIDVGGTDFGYILGSKTNAIDGAHFIKA
jgi:hypothetical protein